MSRFTNEEIGWIAEAAIQSDAARGMAILEEHFTRFRLVEACKAVDQLRGQGQRASEAVTRDRGVLPVSTDRSQVLESYEDGTYLMRDAPAEATGGVIEAISSPQRDRW